MLRARLGQQCLCRLGEPDRQHRAQLCVYDHQSENFTIHALLDWAQCTPLMLNDYRQAPFHRRLCISDRSMKYSPLSCSYSGCLVGCPWRVTAYRSSIPHQERPHSQKDEHQNWTVSSFPPFTVDPEDLFWGVGNPWSTASSAPCGHSPRQLQENYFYSSPCRETSQVDKVIRVYKPGVDF